MVKESEYFRKQETEILIEYINSNDKWGYIDKTGKEVVIPQFYDAKDFSEGLAMVLQIANRQGRYFFIDNFGKFALRLGEGDTPVSLDNYDKKKSKFHSVILIMELQRFLMKKLVKI